MRLAQRLCCPAPPPFQQVQDSTELRARRWRPGLGRASVLRIISTPRAALGDGAFVGRGLRGFTWLHTEELALISS